MNATEDVRRATDALREFVIERSNEGFYREIANDADMAVAQLVAERQQAIDERDEWEREYSKVEQEFSACDVKLGQAIDALREIADHVPGRYVVQSPDYVQLRARARAALLNLGVQP